MVAINDSYLVRFLMLITFLFFAPISSNAKEVSRFIKVHGVVCQFCAQGIKKNLKKLEGVNKVTVDMKTKVVSVLSSDKIEDQKLSKIITDAGFKVVKIGDSIKAVTESKEASGESSDEKDEKSEREHSHGENHKHKEMAN